MWVSVRSRGCVCVCARLAARQEPRRAPTIHPPGRGSPSFRAEKSKAPRKDARRRGALWLINTSPRIREWTVTHVHDAGWDRSCHAARLLLVLFLGCPIFFLPFSRLSCIFYAFFPPPKRRRCHRRRRHHRRARTQAHATHTYPTRVRVSARASARNYRKGAFFSTSVHVHPPRVRSTIPSTGSTKNLRIFFKHLRHLLLRYRFFFFFLLIFHILDISCMSSNRLWYEC